MTADESTSEIEHEKKLAGEAAAQRVEDGMTVGLGTGSTVAYVLPALAARRLDIRCVATSPRTAQRATELGLHIVDYSGLDAPSRLDVAIDGADEVDPAGWLIKGGGGAHTRERLVAAAADRFIVIVSSNKVVERLTPPVPLELFAFGLPATLGRLRPVALRDAPLSPDGGIIADYLGEIGGEPLKLSERLSATTGVVDHGLFAPDMVAEVLVGRGTTVECIVPGRTEDRA